MGSRSHLGVPVAVLLLCAAPAGAVIEVKETVSKTYDTSKPVVVGTVTKVTPENGAVEVKTAETVKGDPFPDQFRVQIRDQPDVIKRVAAGQPLVFFGSTRRGGGAVVNVGDTWLLTAAVPNAQPPLWRAVQVMEDKRRGFPGRTEALVRIVGEVKAGKSTLLNAVDNKRLRGGVRELGNLGVTKPTFLAAADLNGDKKPDLIAGTAGGVKLFLADGDGYGDATAAWGLTGAPGAASAGAVAVGDVNRDGKPDLLIGKTLWVNDGQKFTGGQGVLDLPDRAAVVAAALVDVNGDAKPDAVAVLGDGQLVTSTNLGTTDGAWTKGAARKLAEGATPLAAAFGDWGDNGKPHVIVVTEKAVTRHSVDADGGGTPADFERLAGERLADQRGFADGTKAAAAGVLDLNGDGRKDVLVLGDGGGFVLVNRGFGAFLADLDPGKVLTGQGGAPGDKPPPFKATPATAWAAADVQGDGTDDVLVLADDGRLFAVDNPPPEAKP